MPYVTRIQVEDHYGIPSLHELDIDLANDAKPDFRHLVLTGPNGSGKSSLLRIVWKNVMARFAPSHRNRAPLGMAVNGAELAFASDPQVEWQEDAAIFQHFPPQRRAKITAARQATMNVHLDVQTPNAGVGNGFEQYLVNLKTRHAYATTYRRDEEAKQIDRWFGRLQKQLRTLLCQPKLMLKFDSERMVFTHAG